MGLRQSIQSNVHIWQEDGQFVGLCFGYDFCAEHEWGIRVINNDFGMSGEVGIDGRKITESPDVKLDEVDGISYLWYDLYLMRNSDSVPEHFMRQVKLYGESTYTAAWGDGQFCFAAKDPETKKCLLDMLAAFDRKDVAIYLGGRANPFANSGLNMVIVSRLPEEVVQKMAEKDSDYLKLQEAARKTNIEQTLKDSGKSWFALSPRWKTEEDSDFPVVFFLNPSDQKANNYGWFTVEELKEWANNKGPIVKTEN